MKITTHSAVKEIMQLVKIEILCITVVIAFNGLHNTFISSICTDYLISMDRGKYIAEVASRAKLGFSVIAILFAMFSGSVDFYATYWAIIDMWWISVYLGITLFLSARLIGHNQVKASELFGVVMLAATSVIICSVFWSIWLLIFYRNTMSSYEACVSIDKVMYISRAIHSAFVCILVAICRFTRLLGSMHRI